MLNSFVKWPGGKSKLLDTMERYLPGNINSIKTFIEPFGGSGVVTFHMAKYHHFKNIIFNDLNAQLIDCFRCIKDPVLLEQLKQRLISMEDMYNDVTTDKEEMFYRIRTAFNASLQTISIMPSPLFAAYFIFLNKTCFNGLYRVNKKGEFNTPWNKAQSIKLYDEASFNEFHKLLANVNLQVEDYRTLLSNVDGDSFVYMDPPYMPLTRTASFTAYTSGKFSVKDQEALKLLCDELTKKGTKFMLSNSANDAIKDLYKEYNIYEVHMPRFINSKADSRGEIPELLIMNY